ncbi:MAG: hypothetical protein NVS1B10_02260 [Candidatus Saccharimonadales bacterium]
MDFSNRSAQPQTSAPVGQSPSQVPASSGKRGKIGNDKLGRLSGVTLAGALIVLIIAVVAAIGLTTPDKENKYVDSSKLQAVFLNTGQVYFGNIKSLTKDYFVVSNIYYLQTAGSNAAGSNASANSNSNVSLVKLGCELHQPLDKMVINRTQVTFWENLSDNGQVAKAVSTFQKQNPSGQKCADQSTSSSTNSGNSVQKAGNSSSPSTTPSTTPAPATTPAPTAGR